MARKPRTRDTRVCCVNTNYNKICELTSVIDSLGYETKMSYDTYGRIVKTINARGVEMRHRKQFWEFYCVDE